MIQALLDTNFILSCLREKIDFFEKLEAEGIQIIIPKQVEEELKKISVSKQKLHFKDEAKLAIKILSKNKFKKIDLKTRKVDKGIINYAKENQETIIATLDREIKNKISNRKLIIRNRKSLEII